MNKQEINKQITRRMLFRFFISAVISVSIIIAGSYICQFASHSIPYLKDSNLIDWITDHIVLVGAVLFVLSLFVIVFVQWKQLIAYLTEVSSAVENITELQRIETQFPAVLKETKDELFRIGNRMKEKELAARESEQRKNDLIVYLAHDLKTPISSLIGYLTLLRDEHQISDQMHDRYVRTALSNAERLDDLISEFFEISRFNLSHVTLEYSSINLTRLLEQLVFEIQPMLAEKELICSLDILPDVKLRCDSDKIERVFDNLLRNAVNYSYQNSEIRISGSVTKETVILKFINCGNTIPEEKLGRIFDQFYRLDASRSSSTGGSGLGLAIAKQIVELHQGKITAESHDDFICFTVELPLVGKS